MSLQNPMSLPQPAVAQRRAGSNRRRILPSQKSKLGTKGSNEASGPALNSGTTSNRDSQYTHVDAVGPSNHADSSDKHFIARVALRRQPNPLQPHLSKPEGQGSPSSTLPVHDSPGLQPVVQQLPLPPLVVPIKKKARSLRTQVSVRVYTVTVECKFTLMRCLFLFLFLQLGSTAVLQKTVFSAIQMLNGSAEFLAADMVGRRGNGQPDC